MARNNRRMPFEVALSTQQNGTTTFLNRITTLNNTDAFLNIQRDGTYHFGSGIIVTGNVLQRRQARCFTTDLCYGRYQQPAIGTAGTLSFD